LTAALKHTYSLLTNSYVHTRGHMMPPPLHVGESFATWPQRFDIDSNFLPGGEKKLKICLFVLTEFTNVIDGQTDGHTDTAWRHGPRLHSIARQ